MELAEDVALAAASSRAPAYTLDWFGCDLRTGQIIEDLPYLKPTGTLSKRLGQSTSTTFELSLAGAGREWEAATAQGRTLLVGVDRDNGLPVWSGIVLTRDGGSGLTVDIGAATPEAYLDRRYTGTQTFVGQDQATIITALMAAPLSQGPPLIMDAPATGTPMDFTALDSDDKTVLSSLQEIMAMDGGPEWTIDVDWSDSSRTGFVLPVRVRPKIGYQSGEPEAVFDFPGCVSSYRLTESYEQGKAATVVTARGEGEGDARLTSAAQIATSLEAGGWPRYVYRYTPASGITDPAQLDAHARASLAVMATGASVWSADAVASRAPRIGRDWGIGDMVRLSITSSPRHPAGAEIVARAWAWDLDPGADTVRPILVEED